MTKETITSIPTSTISADELKRIKSFIAQDEGSASAAVLRQTLVALARHTSVDILLNDEVISPNSAAEILKMSRPHLLKFMDNGHLPFHRVGTHRRIKVSDLRKFMAARAAGAEVLANALQGPATPLTQSAGLSESELAELREN
ncbi:excisionase family DNA-binding protein [Corynebacterium sp. AOP40-9SA-29]|uniref:excisionase family DNA-binding protein n=1 Tax=Corynebacterium sp. AOP40-9SA-29 TaxID=3457677 RepID=UPI0040349038